MIFPVKIEIPLSSAYFYASGKILISKAKTAAYLFNKFYYI